MSSKGPAPRVDLSKKGIEDLNDFLLGEKSISQLIEENDDKEEADSESSELGKGIKKKKNSSFLVTANSPKANPKSPSTSLISKLKDAQTLLLSNNKIKFVPLDFPVRFEELRALYLDHNNISEFPGALCQLPHLEKLHLEFNLIKEIPSEIKMLKSSLKKLYLFNNELESLPEEIGELTLLSTLDIHNNNIGILPYQLALNSQLTELSIYNNPILSPPPFICNKGIVHIVKYMREIRESYIQTVPEDQYIWSRKINITEAKSKLKRTPSAKVLTRNQSSLNESKSTKAISAEIKKKGGSAIFRDVIEDNVFISQSHLLYYLTDYHCHETCGRREYMEDRCIALPRLKQHKPTGLLSEVVNMFSKVGYFGVYDGHGGDKCADYLIEHMHRNIVNQSAFAKGDFETAIKNGFKTTDEAFLKKCKEHGLIDGSTALVALLIDDKLITGHAGDSRAVLCRDKKAVRLTEDHKPDRVDELARVEDMGGEVIYRGNCFRVMGDLAMSRSFGDLRLKDPKPYVICDPEIRIEELTPKDEFIILASDGLWDVFTDQRAVDLVRKCANVEEASKKLVETALALGTMDNTTVIVVKLDWCLDFVTQNELDGKPENTKRPTSKELSASVSTATTAASSSNNNINNTPNNNSNTNSTTSFRNSLETPEFNVKSIYPQVSASQTAIKLKVLIPHIEATKLMKFDVGTTIKEIERVIQRKHRFEETLEIEIFKKNSTGDILLNKDNTLKDYEFQDMDQIELRKLGTAPAAPHEDAPSTAVTDEVLSQSENELPSTHRTTMLWEGSLINNNIATTTASDKESTSVVDVNNNNTDMSEWRRVKPDSTSNRRDTYRVPPPGSPRLDAVKPPFQDELNTHEYDTQHTDTAQPEEHTVQNSEEQKTEEEPSLTTNTSNSQPKEQKTETEAEVEKEL